MSCETVPVSAAAERGPEASHAAAWFSLWVMVAATLFAFVDRQVLALVAEPMARDLGLKDAQLGVIQGLGFALFGLVATYPLGWLCDRWDRRIVLAGCVSLWAIGTAACGLVDGYVPLLLATCAIAAGEAGLVPVVYAAIPDIFDGKRRVTANQVFYVATILGSSAGLFLGGAAISAMDALRSQLPASLTDWPSWRLVFVAVAAPAPLLMGLIAFARLGRRPTFEDSVRRAHHAVSSDGFVSYLRENVRPVVLTLTALCAYGLPFGGLLAFTPVALARLFETSAAQSGFGMGVAVAVGCVLGVAAASVLMRTFARRLGARAPLRISAVALLIFLPVAALLPWIENSTQAFVLVGLEMVVGTLVGSLLPSIIQGLASQALRGRMSALYSILSTVTAGVATWLVGPISDHLHANPRGLLFAITWIFLASWIAAVVLLLISERPFEKLSKALETQSFRSSV